MGARHGSALVTIGTLGTLGPDHGSRHQILRRFPDYAQRMRDQALEVATTKSEPEFALREVRAFCQKRVS